MFQVVIKPELCSALSELYNIFDLGVSDRYGQFRLGALVRDFMEKFCILVIVLLRAFKQK